MSADEHAKMSTETWSPRRRDYKKSPEDRAFLWMIMHMDMRNATI